LIGIGGFGEKGGTTARQSFFDATVILSQAMIRIPRGPREKDARENAFDAFWKT
jgi:hypothetical protein